MADPLFITPEVETAETADSTAFFFRRIGEICFTSESDVVTHEPESPGGPPGRCRRLAVAPRYGVTVFADFRGVYIAKTATLLEACEKVADGESVPAWNPKGLCLCVLPGDSRLVVLSPDQHWLAVCMDNNVYVFSMRRLTVEHSPAPWATWSVPMGLKEFAWRPGERVDTLPEGSVVTREGQLLLGEIGSPLKAFSQYSGSVSTVGWSPDGERVAIAHLCKVHVWDTATKAHFVTKITSQDAQQKDARLVVDTLVWTGPNSILVASHLFEQGDDYGELDMVSISIVQWAAWDMVSRPRDLRLLDFFPLVINVDATAPGSGPHLLTACVRDWGMLLYAHRKADDDHVHCIQLGGPNKLPLGVEVTEDRSSIRIPFMTDEASNYVIGLGIDLTCMDVEVLDPNPEAGELKPSPVLLVATTDGVLRFYTFSNSDKAQHQQLAADALEYPPVEEPARPAAGGGKYEEAEETEAAAASTALPDEDDDFGEEAPAPPSTASLPGPPQAASPAAPPQEAGQQDTAAAAATALPPDGSDLEEEGEDEEEDDEEEGEEEEGPAESEGSVSSRMASVVTPRATGGRERRRPSSGSEASAESVGSRTPRQAGASSGPVKRGAAEMRAEVARPQAVREEDEGESSSNEGQSRLQPAPPEVEEEGFGESTAAAPPPLPAAPTFGVPAFSFGGATSGATTGFPAFSMPLPARPGAPHPAFASFGAAPFGTPSAFSYGPGGLKPTLPVAAPSSPPDPAGPSGAGPAAPPPTPTSVPSVPAPAGLPTFGGAGPGFVPPIPSIGIGASKPGQPFGGVASAFAPPPAGPVPAASEPERAAQGRREAAGPHPVAAADKPSKPQDKEAAGGRGQAASPKKDEAAPQEDELAKLLREAQRPVARLQSEAAEVVSMEADILQSMYDVDILELRMGFALQKAEGREGSGEDTRTGHVKVRRAAKELRSQTSQLLHDVADAKAQFEKLQHGWREDRLRTEALLHFHRRGGKAGAPEEGGGHEPLEPALATLRDSLLQCERVLTQQARDLKKCLDVLEERRDSEPLAKETPAVHVCKAVNAQASIIEGQVGQLEELQERLKGLGVDKVGEFGELPGPFDSRQGFSAYTPASNGMGSTGTPVWQAMRDSPAGRKPLLSPLHMLGTPPRDDRHLSSPWTRDDSDELRANILDKVTSKRGKVRVLHAKPPPDISEAAPAARQESRPSSPDDVPPLVSPNWRPAAAEARPARPPASMERAASSALRGAAPTAPFESASRMPRSAQASNLPASPLPMQKPASPHKRGAPSEDNPPPPAPFGSQGSRVSAVNASAAKAVQPPIPSRSQVRAAQQLQQSVLGRGATDTTPPAPSQPATAVAASAADTEAPVAKPAVKKAVMPPVPSRAQMQAAQALQASVLGKEAAPKSSEAPTASAPHPARSAPETKTTASLFGSLGASSGNASPFGNSAAPNSSASPFGNLGGSSSSPSPFQSGGLATVASVQSAASGQLGSLSFSAFQPFSNPAMSAPPTPTPIPQASMFPPSSAPPPTSASPFTPTSASAPSVFGNMSAPAQSPFGTGSMPVSASPFAPSSSPAPASTPFGGFGLGGFGASAPTSSPFSVSGSAVPPTPQSSAAAEASLASGMSGFGLGGSSPFAATTPAPSPFVRDLSFPAASSAPAPAPAPPFGSMATGGAFGSPAQPQQSVFGGFSQPSSSGLSTPAFSGGAFGAGATFGQGFGQNAGFGQPAGVGASTTAQAGIAAFGQPATPGFGAPATPGFGTHAMPGFGATATPGFGAPAAPGFGASPAAPAFAQGSSTAFGNAANMGGGFGAFADQSKSGFSVAASQGGGFGGQSGGFGAFGQGGGGISGVAQTPSGFGGLWGGSPAGVGAPPSANSGNNAMWQPRK